MSIQSSSLANLIFVALFLSAPHAHAQDTSGSVGEVQEITGQAWSSSGNGATKTPLLSKGAIAEHTVLYTGPNSSLHVTLNDGSTLKLGSNSQVEMDYGVKDGSHVTLKLREGVLKSLVKKRVDQERSFRIKTQAVTLGVRGTEFVASVREDSRHQQDQQVWVSQGSVQISDSKGKELALVNPGMALHFNAIRDSAGNFVIKENALKPLPMSTIQIQQFKTDQLLGAPPPQSRNGSAPPPPPPPPRSGSAGAPPPPGVGMGMPSSGSANHPSAPGTGSGSGVGSGAGNGVGGGLPPGSLSPTRGIPPPPVPPPPTMQPNGATGPAVH